MAEFKVTAQDGTQYKIMGDTTPTDAEIDTLIQSQSVDTPSINTDITKIPTTDATPQQIEILAKEEAQASQPFAFAPAGWEEATAAKGKIGAVESFMMLNKLELLPYINGATLFEDTNTYLDMKKVQDGTATQEQQANAFEAIRDMRELEIRGRTGMAKFANAAFVMPAYALEFATTFGIGTAAKKSAKVLAKKGIKKSYGKILKEMTEQASKATLKSGLKAAPKALPKIAAKTAVKMPHRIGKKYLETRISETVSFTDKGQAILKDAETKPATAFARAFGDVFIENLSESAGGALLKPAGKVIGKGIKSITPTVAKKFAQKLSETAVGKGAGKVLKFNTRWGFDGIVEEVGEERVGDALRFAFDLDQEKGYSFEQLLDALVPDKEQAMTEFGLVALFGVASKGAAKLETTFRGRNIPQEEIDKIIELTSELEKDAMIEEDELDKLKDIETEEDIIAFEEKMTEYETAIEGREETPQVMEIIGKLAETRAVKDNVTRKEFLDSFLDQIKTDVVMPQFSADVYNQEGNVKEQSHEFKDWFEGSQAKTEKGEPLPVYHGSPVSDITEFKDSGSGIFFSDNKDVAQSYTTAGSKPKDISEVYLNAKKIKEVNDFKGKSFHEFSEADFAKWDTVFNEAKQEGYDGVKVTGVIDSQQPGQKVPPSNVYAVFEPNQIKATSNKAPTADANIYKQENGDVRGQFDPMKKIITIFETADKSTIVHELAHSYLTYVQKVSTTEYAKIANWSATQTKDAGLSQAAQIQEHFARGFEAYLRTGKAPSAELKTTFEHFKEWLSDIYESITQLNIKLDQEIVDYFDSMLAGKVEERSSEMEILLQSGMSKEEATKALSDMEAIKELKALTKNVNADNVKELQTKITKFIRELPISQENKAKFISSIKEVRGQVSFDRAVDKILKRATQYYETELKNKYEEKIAKEIKMSKNITQAGRTVGKFDYTTNQVFKSIKEYDKMTQEDAFELFEKSQGKFEDDLKNLGTNGIKLRFLALKSGGKKYSSSTLYRNVYEDLKGLREQGRDAKQLQQWFDKLNNVENIKETKAQIDKLKALKISSAFDRGLGDFETLMNTIGGKDFSEKFNFIEAQKNEYVEQLESQQEINEIIQKVYKAKPSQVPQIVLALNNDTNYSLEYQNKDLGVKNMSKMNIISVYNLIQNPKVKQDYFDAFGEIQVLELVNQLTAEERAFGDGLKRWLADAYTGINEVYVKLNNVDLPMVENYFPSRSEHTNYNDIFNDFKNQSTNPSFVKSRIAGQTVPDPTIDAYQAVISYSQQAAYIKNVGMRHRELQVMFKDLAVKNAIVSKYSQKTYDNILNKLDNYTLSGLKSKQDSLTSATNRIIGNWTMAKIGLNLGVYAKQMISQINFATGMPSDQFSKFYLQGMMNPAKTKKFMMEGSAYLRARKEKGGSDIVADAIASSERLSGGASQAIYEASGFNSVKMKEYITSLQRRGDIAGWVYGGYAKVQHLMKNEGLTQAEAFNRMENEGLKTQQSSLSSQMADIQNSAGLGRLFTKFKNTQLQYYRLMKNATTQALRGEIDLGSYSKIMTTYGLVNPALFGYMGYFFGTGLYEMFQDDNDDETNEEKLTKDMFFAIATNPINAIPFYGQIYDSVLRSAVYDYSFDPSVPIVGDAYDAFTGYGGKFDPSAYEIISTLAETTTGAPVKTWGRYLKKAGVTGEEKKKSGRSSRSRNSRSSSSR